MGRMAVLYVPLKRLYERGWKTVWFNHRHEQLPEGAPEPDVTVYSMEELLQIK